MADKRPRRYVSYRPELDGLRGVAVMFVFLQHAQITGIRNAGAVGVTMFFTLSGFLITSLLMGEREATGTISLPRFYWHRALRLLPALTVLVGVVLLIGVVTGRSMALQAAAVMGYVGNWVDIAGLDMWVLGHTWSLAIEEQFYLAWPLLLFILPNRRSQFVACIVGIVAAVVLRAALFDPAPHAIGRYYMGLDTRADALMLGCLLALFRWSAPRWAGMVGGLLIIGLVVLVRDKAVLANVGIPLSAVATALLIAARSQLTWRPLVALGGISYGFYLWHFPIIGATRPFVVGLPAPLVVVGWFGATLAVAFLSRRLIELPCLRLRNRAVHLPRLRGRIVSVAGAAE